MTLIEILVREQGLFSTYSNTSANQLTHASSLSNARRYNKHQSEWLGFSENTINQLIEMMRDPTNTFEKLYRFAARERAVIAKRLGHYHDPEIEDSSAFGQFRDEQDDLLADSFETLFNKDCEQPWAEKREQLFKVVRELIDTESNKTSGKVRIEETKVGPQAYTEDLTFDGGVAYVIDTLLHVNNQEFDLSRIVLMHNPQNDSQDIMQMFYADLAVLPLSKVFELANHKYRSMMESVVTDCKEDRQIFLNKMGGLMALMAPCLPVLRGNSAICEWIMRAALFTKGMALGEFNYDTNLAWDFKALVTPNQTIYADWFSKNAIGDMVVSSGPEPSRTFTM